MGVTCQLVRLDPAELPAIRSDPIEVIGLIEWDAPSDRWIDLDQAWLMLLAVFEAQPRADTLVRAVLPGPPAFDESASGGQTVTFVDPDLVRLVAGALGGLDGAAIEGTGVDAAYLSAHLDVLRDFYRRAAAARQAVAVVIG
jgi:ABC-type amino acid transport substrate-binding protein